MSGFLSGPSNLMSSAGAMASMGQSPSASSAPKVPTDKGNSTEVQKAVSDEQARLRALKGRSSTLLTGPLGVMDTANVQKKTLLGQ